MISAVSTTTPRSDTPARQATLGQADFIRLMTTQMKLQDPLEPVDNKEMIAQMAQFSSLSGINTINTTLQAISAQIERVLPAPTGTQPTSTNA